jgi:hypothetical protein
VTREKEATKEVKLGGEVKITQQYGTFLDLILFLEISMGCHC